MTLATNEYIFGLNRALDVASGEYVAFLNNDMTVEEDFVERCLAHFVAPDVFAVCPRIIRPWATGRCGRDLV